MPQKWSAQKQDEAMAWLRNGLSCRKTAAKVGVSAATAVRWARAAGLAGGTSHRLAPATRAALVAALAAGARPAEAAARFKVSRSTAARLAPPREDLRAVERAALSAALTAGYSRRRAAAALGLSVATAIRWARELSPLESAPASPTPQRPRPPRYRADREAKRAALIAAIESGLSRRQAAAEVGLPIATAIRWASGAVPHKN